jgi:glycosyltransferase involved in cell wall biosynthesis
MSLPSVTAVMAAYNAEAFIGEALDSALDQDYPPELLDVVVVDDGSTDGTAAVVAERAERHPGRVTLVQQPNAGNVAAVATGIGYVLGDMTALLDADDAWPRDKTSRQVAAMRPEVNLVYGDMTVIDAEGKVLQESWLAGDDPPSGRCAGALLEGNPVTASSVLMRTSFARSVTPIPPGIPWADWWFAVRAALQSEIAYQPEPRTLYRFHGANLTLGVQGIDRLRELTKAVTFQRWFLRRIDLRSATPAQLHTAWAAFERNACEAVSLSGSVFAPLVEVTDEDRAKARTLVARAVAARAAGRTADAAAGFLHAAAADPWLTAARDGLAAALSVLPGGEDLPGQQPLAGARDLVVLADAEELLDAPWLLDAWVSEMEGCETVTLAIDAAALDAERAAEELGALTDRAGVGSAPGLDVVAVMGPLDEVGRARLEAGAHAVLSERPVPPGHPPRYGGADLAALRAHLTGKPGALPAHR